MEIRIQVKTPTGKAESTLPLLKRHLLGFNPFDRAKYEAWATDDTIYIHVKASLKKCLKIQKNVSMFDNIMKMALTDKRVTKYLSQEANEELQDMLINQTKISIIKIATAEEIESNGKSFWDNMKEKLRRVI